MAMGYSAALLKGACVVRHAHSPRQREHACLRYWTALSAGLPRLPGSLGSETDVSHSRLMWIRNKIIRVPICPVSQL